MSGFDKFCAATALLLGIALLILGVLGLFVGCKAYFTLPPILGVLPAIVGWGVIRAVMVAWNVPRSRPPSTQDYLDQQHRFP